MISWLFSVVPWWVLVVFGLVSAFLLRRVWQLAVLALIAAFLGSFGARQRSLGRREARKEADEAADEAVHEAEMARRRADRDNALGGLRSDDGFRRG